jgi:hypothetical protein
MARGAAMRDAWTRDAFLRNQNRKFDQFNVTRNRQPAKHLKSRPVYVPIHEKRRDNLRLAVRQQMTDEIIWG